MTLDFLEHMRNSQTRLHEQKIAFGLNDKKDDFVVLEDDTLRQHLNSNQTSNLLFFTTNKANLSVFDSRFKIDNMSQNINAA